MSTDEAAIQPSTAAGHEKASSQAQKSSATFSSFINKNTTGKKFAPKAARRRPGTAPAASAPKSASEPVAPQSTAPREHPEEHTDAASSTVDNSVTANATTSTIEEPSSAATAPISSHAPTITEPEQATEQEPVNDAHTRELHIAQSHPAEDELDAGREVKRPRMDPPVRNVTTTDTAINKDDIENVMQAAQTEIDSGSQYITDYAVASSVEHVEPVLQHPPQATEAGKPSVVEEQSGSLQLEHARVLPWTAVNQVQTDEEGEVASADTRPARTSRSKRTARAPSGVEDRYQEPSNDALSETSREKATTKTRGKQKANAANVDSEAKTSAPTTRARKPRKTKGKERADDEGTVTGDGAEQSGAGEDSIVSPKPRQPRRKKSRSTTIGEGEGNENDVRPKQKGRPPRESTPVDAEDLTIDPEITYMDSLASRNIRVGKLSSREKQMREIDWVAVRQRQREEDSRPIKTKEAQEAAEKALADLAPTADSGGTRYHVVDGRIEIVPSSTFVDREADADREIDNYVTVEDQDLTTRITSRSFMKNNKRFPNEFILPGQGKRWTAADTQLFYQGLRSFGTDFQMISHMFPGSTRRSIKTKFTREEREHPDDVREALHGQSEMATHWDTFLKASQMEEAHFADADEIKRELAEQEAEMREQILAATEETRLRNDQKRVAGMLEENGDGEGGNKENGKGKKKRKGKDKHVTFEEEKGVEIVGNIDDDDDWGKE